MTQIFKFFALFTSIALSDTGYCTKFKITVTPKIDKQNVIAHLETNIPGSPSLAVTISLKNQMPADPYIGTQFESVPIKNGRGDVSLDISQLPNGSYEVVANYFPLWEENSSIKDNVGEIEGKHDVAINNVGRKSAREVLKQKQNQGWVRQNVHSGMKWEPGTWISKFGSYKEVPLKKDYLNPRIIKLYYFESIDMTLMVNVLKNEISVWRDGLADS